MFFSDDDVVTMKYQGVKLTTFNIVFLIDSLSLSHKEGNRISNFKDLYNSTRKQFYLIIQLNQTLPLCVTVNKSNKAKVTIAKGYLRHCKKCTAMIKPRISVA